MNPDLQLLSPHLEGKQISKALVVAKKRKRKITQVHLIVMISKVSLSEVKVAKRRKKEMRRANREKMVLKLVVVQEEEEEAEVVEVEVLPKHNKMKMKVLR